MNKLAQLLRSTFYALAFAGSGSALAGQNIWFYQSQPGDFLGQGAEVTVTSADGAFSIPTQARRSTAQVQFLSPVTGKFLMITLSAADSAPLAPGAYENAVRPGFGGLLPPGQPGLDFIVDNRACNTVTGRFDLLEYVSDGFGGIVKLAVNYEEHCEGAAPAVFGQLRVNSDIPILKPLVIAVETPLNTRGCVEATSPNGAPISVNANDAVDSLGGRSLQFNWSATTGDVGTAPTFSFTGPLTKDPLKPVVVTLSLTDLTNNFVRTATQSICISDTTGPAIVINAPVPGQVVVGDSLILDVTIKDAVDKNITQYEVLVGSDYLSPLNPTTGHARQNVLARPNASGSVAVTVTVRATDASGNTGQRSVTVNQTP